MSQAVYDAARGTLKTFLRDVLRDTIRYTEHAQRVTVTALDVLHGLKRQGRILYGFGDDGHSGRSIYPHRHHDRRQQRQQPHLPNPNPNPNPPSPFAILDSVPAYNACVSLRTIVLSQAETDARRAAVHAAMDADAPNPHFLGLSPAKMQEVVDAYDGYFFDGRLLPFFASRGLSLHFRVDPNPAFSSARLAYCIPPNLFNEIIISMHFPQIHALISTVRSHPVASRMRQFPSGVYDAPLAFPLQMNLKFFNDVMCFTCSRFKVCKVANICVLV